jgi:transcriptional regulator with XRE-family HTH domain
MTNKAYPRYILKNLMHDDRVEAGISQEAIGKCLGKTQRQISDFENGYINATPEFMIRWFTVLKAYEHIDLVQYIYSLHPLAAVPVTPELNDNAAKAMINLQEQIHEAEYKLSAIRQWISNLRPTRISAIKTDDWQQVYDVYRALQTFIYAGMREFDLDINDLTSRWSTKALTQGVAMTYKPKKAAMM